jgi:hypothetical protein
MKPTPNQSIPSGCAVVTPQCTFGDMETAFRRSMGRHVGHIVKVPKIERWYKPRTNQQNRTVKGLWMPIILEELGFHPHDEKYVYDMIKIAINWTEPRTNPKTGEVTMVPKPTAHLDTDGYSGFMRIFRAYVEDQDSGLGILLPEPDSMMARR